MMREIVLVVLICLLGPGLAIAGPDMGVSYTLHWFTDVDDVAVYTHYGLVDLGLENGMDLEFQMTHDVVVIPGIDFAPGSQEATDAITTASRPVSASNNAFEDFVKTRQAFQASLGYRNVNVGYYVSTESDYFAQMGWVGYNHEMLESNLNISVGYSYSWDDIRPLEDDGGVSQRSFRRTHHWNLIATQILTPTTVLRFGGELNQVVGLQHDPYRGVYAGGGSVRERHPFQRDRYDAFVRLSQYLKNRSSLKFDYKYYTDDWGIDSHTMGGRLAQYITEQVVVRYRYRYYTQAAAMFFSDDYLDADGIGGYVSGDYRLGEFGAHLFGLRIDWDLARAFRNVGFLARARLRLGYERYFNSNNFTANVVETGFDLSF